MKAKDDREALNDVVKGRRYFDLAEDPLLTCGACPNTEAIRKSTRRSAGFVLGLRRTVKRLKDGTWNPRHMD